MYQAELCSWAEQTLMSSWKPKQSNSNSPFKVNRGCQHRKPLNMQKMKRVYFLKRWRTCKQRQRLTEEWKVTCNMQLSGKNTWSQDTSHRRVSHHHHWVLAVKQTVENCTQENDLLFALNTDFPSQYVCTWHYIRLNVLWSL